MALTGLFSVLAGAGLVLFGEPLAMLLYHEESVGQYMRVLGFIAPFMYLESMVDGILKGMGEQMATFRYSILDSALRILAMSVLIPWYGMAGFLAVMAASNLLTCTLNLHRMLHCADMKPDWAAWFILPAAVAGIGLTPVLWLRRFLPDTAWSLGAEMTVFALGAGIPLLLAWHKNKTALVRLGTGRPES